VAWCGIFQGNLRSGSIHKPEGKISILCNQRLIAFLLVVCAVTGLRSQSLNSALVNSALGASAQDLSPKEAERQCQSSDPNERLVGCTAVINGRGFGSKVDLVDAFDGRCWAYNDLGQFERGLADCKASIAINPKYFYAYNNLGTSLLGLGDISNAIAAFSKSIDLKPNFVYSHVNRAKAFLTLGNQEMARKDFESVLLIDPLNQDARAAIDTLDNPAPPILKEPKGLPTSPADDSRNQPTLPKINEPIAKALLTDDPFITDCDAYAASDSDPKRKGAGIPFDQINPQRAIPACLDALRDYPNSARFQYQAGRAYEKNGEFAEALKWYRKSADQGYETAKDNLQKIEKKR